MQAYFEDPSDTGQVNLSQEIHIGVLAISNSTSSSFGFLADSISDDIGIGVNISEFENHFSLVENLSNGVINIAIADAIPSWKAWKHDGMSVLASLLDKQEKVFSDTFAVVRSDSEFASTDPFSLMNGISPCFSGRDIQVHYWLQEASRKRTNQLDICPRYYPFTIQFILLFPRR